MSIAFTLPPGSPFAGSGTSRHPNEMDLVRVTRALSARERYLYVRPDVLPVEGGYLVRSPCCSRGPDPDGGTIDIARLEWRESVRCWVLHRKVHAEDRWLEDSLFARLPDALARLNTDPERQFWQ
ncbi:hypothetical protein Y88_0022 [Novosphingobium nitrogenifigens DSM 19370]|uniref:DUF3024 domain-containing protein n=1 Tax=Novosphingobium nitrogenifigens DSM 19370 TaxID=983920 RepID=F1Z4T8_9SPHN|nr:hypothetical protein [Novosphingobium nitrogenifigens]EGD60374.1 hypothetical protein Y88_0022 [Novosphingobium nitrogenifigens DSM 19370]